MEDISGLGSFPEPPPVAFFGAGASPEADAPRFAPGILPAAQIPLLPCAGVRASDGARSSTRTAEIRR